MKTFGEFITEKKFNVEDWFNETFPKSTKSNEGISYKMANKLIEITFNNEKEALRWDDNFAKYHDKEVTVIDIDNGSNKRLLKIR